MPNFILTTCGTSILTNGASSEDRTLVGKTANHREADLDATQRAALDTLRASRTQELADATPERAARLSAELNGILSHYAFNPSAEAKRRDVHYLLASDTHLGRMTRDLAADWLRAFGFAQVVPLDVADLRTSSLDEFRSGTSDLTSTLDRVVSEHRNSGHRIHFNLTGGFKSVNAFIQLLGALWADEVFFVFESSRELMRIPRLPFKLDAERTVTEHLPTFRRLAIVGSAPLGDLADFPDGLLLTLGSEAWLSQWAEAVFASLRHRIYSTDILPPWTDRVRFAPTFLKSTTGLAADRNRLLNERIDDLCRFALTGQRLSRLDVKALQGKQLGPSTHEADAWSDGSADRLFLHPEGPSWVLDRLGQALH